MVGAGRDTAKLSDKEESNRAMNEFDGKGMVRVSSRPTEPVYAVDMPFDELLDPEQATVGDVTGPVRLNNPAAEETGIYHSGEVTAYVDLNTPDGEHMGRYDALEYRPNTELSVTHGSADSEDSGRLLGKRGSDYVDLTKCADEEALKELRDITGSGDILEP
jgi:hypothetical protein